MNEQVTQAAGSRRSARLKIAIVVGAFVVPIGVAWWFALVNPPGDGFARLNHGQLLNPTLDIRTESRATGLHEIDLGPGEWAMLYFAPGRCGETCQRAIADLRTIRSVLGYSGQRVRVHAIVDLADGGEEGLATPAAPTDTGAFAIVDPEARRLIAEHVVSQNTAGESGLVFLDWRGQIMMYFPDVASPGDIKKDLKRLLRGSRTD